METNDQVLIRVRRPLKAAMARSPLTLPQLCEACESAVRSLRPLNRSGPFDFNEMKYTVREVLKVPEATVRNYELKILFHHLGGVDPKPLKREKTKSLKGEELLQFLQNGRKPLHGFLEEGVGVDPVELIDYLAHGPEYEASRGRKAKKLQRVHKNLRTGFHQSFTDAGSMAVRKSFNHFDMTGEGKLSPSGFSNFVRNGLHLSRWDVPNDDMMSFYTYLDRDGGGLDVEEVVSVIGGGNKDGPRDFSFLEDELPPKVEKKKTYKQELEEMLPSSSLPNLTIGYATPQRPWGHGPIIGLNGVGAAAARKTFALRASSSFVNLGRTRSAVIRQSEWNQKLSPGIHHDGGAQQPAGQTAREVFGSTN